MNQRLAQLLKNNEKKKKEQLQKVRKLGNCKKTWDSKTLKHATIYIDGD